MATIDVLGSATDPISGGTVATTGALQAGRYRVTVTTAFEGTIVAVVDQNNFQLQVGATAVGPLSSEGAVGIPFENAPMTVDVPAAAALLVTTAGTGSPSAVYKAQITAVI